MSKVSTCTSFVVPQGTLLSDKCGTFSTLVSDVGRSGDISGAVSTDDNLVLSVNA